MKTLHISVANKIATFRDRDGVIVCNNSDYVIEFNFDSEWSECAVKTARFIYNGTVEDAVFSGNKVSVPIIKNALFVTVGVFSGELKTTTPARIECMKSILCADGVPPDPSPDVYNQIIGLLNSGESVVALEARVSEVERQMKELPVVTVDAPGIVKSSTAENRVMAAPDGSGELEVVSLNMRKLTQTEGDTIILRGKI